MDDLSITPLELRTRATNMRSKVMNMKDSLGVATRVMGMTADSFKGSAADTIREKFDVLSNKFNDFYDAMTKYANFLDETAEAYETSNTTIQKVAEEVLTSEYDA